VRGFGGWYLYEIALCLHAGNLLSHAFRNRLKCHLLQSNRHGFRNRLKCHLLQSIILSLSLLVVFHILDNCDVSLGLYAKVIHMFDWSSGQRDRSFRTVPGYL
jgi:hypothetical protein